MARRAATMPLNVYQNGKLVGRFRRSGAVDFQYDPTWLVWDNAIPVSLSLPLREDRFIGDPVIAVFDNLLPDNQGIRRRGLPCKCARKFGDRSDECGSGSQSLVRGAPYERSRLPLAARAVEARRRVGCQS
jgi:HipA-like protein